MTPQLTPIQIKEIAEELDMGNRCYFHRTTLKLLFIPDFDNNSYAEREFFEEELDELENNFDEYMEIAKPNSNDSFEIMLNFVESLDYKNNLKQQLANALQKSKPFRHFKFLIDNSGPCRQQWFDFKSQQLQQWVLDKFNEAIDFDRT